MKLQPLLCTEAQRQYWAERFASLAVIRLTPRQVSDVELLGNGGYTPLRGYLGRRDYQSVLTDMRLSDGTPWSIPITLAVSQEVAKSIKEDTTVGLTDAEGKPLAVLHVRARALSCLPPHARTDA
ncbi:MAG: hypothetical protein ACP5RN_04325 [Armatimonadota bacterium]